MVDRSWLLAFGPALLFQPGVDVNASVAGGPADLDERRPAAFLPPPFEGTDAHLELVGELLLGEERICHGTPDRYRVGFCPAAPPSVTLDELWRAMTGIDGLRRAR
jgi:hypothetical protein